MLRPKKRRCGYKEYTIRVVHVHNQILAPRRIQQAELTIVAPVPP